MDLAYIYFTLSSAFNAVVITILGALVFIQNRKSYENKIFILFCAAVAFWAYAYIFWPLARTSEGTLLSFQLLHIGACYVFILYLHFTVIWLNIYKIKKVQIYFGYIVATIFSLSVFSTNFISGMAPKFSMRYWAEPGILYHLYLVMFFGFVFYSSLLSYYNNSLISFIIFSSISK